MLAAAEMRVMAFARYVPFLIGGALLLAGLFQLTAWKARQLGLCRGEAVPGRTPPAGRLREAWRHGVRLGRRCGWCCAGFMMILLVAGVMDLGVMAVVTAAISLERFAPESWRVARAAGIVALAAAAFVIVRALLVV
jgi:predicted metal-binding membrane protein